MRIIVITGKGGVGKTTVSAATAYKISKSGKKTLVMSTDPAHSLGDSFDIKLGASPIQICDNLYAQEVDVRSELLKHWGQIKDFIRDNLKTRGIDSVIAEELSIFPGMEELFSMLLLKEYYVKGEFDTVVIDCAPTASTIRQLSFPEIGSWYLKKIFPVHKAIIQMARPVAHKLYDVNLPDENVFNNIKTLILSLDGMKEILSDVNVTTVRFVVNLEKMVIKEAARAFTYMNVFGFPVDAVIVNRIYPEFLEDKYFHRWKEIQKVHLKEVEERFSSLEILKARLFDTEITGLEMLEKLADELYREKNPYDIYVKESSIKVIEDNGNFVLKWKVPGYQKENIELFAKGEELILSGPGFMRNLLLPNILVGKEIKKADFDGTYLNVDF